MRIARSADGYVGSSGAGLPGFTRRVKLIKHFAAEGGRDPKDITIIGVVYGCVDPSRERAYDLAAKYAEAYYGPGVRDLEFTRVSLRFSMCRVLFLLFVAIDCEYTVGAKSFSALWVVWRATRSTRCESFSVE